MKKILLLGCFMLIIDGACVDRIDFDIKSNPNFPIVINGFISNKPGPYQVTVSKAFDIDSKLYLKEPINVKRMVISDNTGFSEQLFNKAQGIYSTSENGIQGVVGRNYKLEVELLDGRFYESIPDTLFSSDPIDSVYFQQVAYKETEGTSKPGFDFYFDTSLSDKNSNRYLWKFKGTYQIDTNPELYDTLCIEARCPKPKFCSGYKVEGSGELIQVRPCECCTCWVDFYNDKILISDNQVSTSSSFAKIKASTIPINQWTFMYKVHAEIQQFGLSQQAFLFWRAIKNQNESIGSIFQPSNGKIPSNFIQTKGTDGPILGLFYAASINTKSTFITPFDVHPQNLIPPQNVPFINDCRRAFPYSSIEKPSFWE